MLREIDVIDFFQAARSAAPRPPNAAARKIVDSIFSAITDAAANGDEVALNGFGKFKIKDRGLF